MEEETKGDSKTLAALGTTKKNQVPFT
jgi:hypothetical protein